MRERNVAEMKKNGRVDHQLRYKKTIGADKDIEAIEAELLKCAQTVSETDCHMEEIKDMIGDFEKI